MMESTAEGVIIQDSFIQRRRNRRLGIGRSLSAYLELTKPRITALVVLAAAAGFYLGSKEQIAYHQLLNLVMGVALLSSGLGTLNQYIERDTDALMLRTRSRPLPSGKLSPPRALLFGLVLGLIGTVYLLVFVNPLTALLGAATLASYLFLYTPLKTKTPLSTFVGAFPGAIPPLMGWAAARGEVTMEAWILFAILFLWQFPHFHAIGWLYREDFARAGIKFLPVIEQEGRKTGQQVVISALMLLPMSLLPTVVNLTGRMYFIGAFMLGLAFLYFGVRAAQARSKWQARRLFQASVLYQPALFVLMVIDHQ